MRPVLAILQNMWVNNPQRVRKMIENTEHGETLRQRLIRYALFAGCKTGRRIKSAFGDELIECMEFDEVSREISGNPSFVPTPDRRHVYRTIKYHNPKILIAFGKLASETVRGLWKGPLIVAPHPAARRDTVMDELKEAARKLKLELEKL